MKSKDLRLLQALWLLLILPEAGPQKVNCASWCPQNSSCLSASACRCDPGFISSSGESILRPGDTCDDINECLSVSCGNFAHCNNIEGSYQCMCDPGYELLSGETTFKNETENTCQDINECEPPISIHCGLNAECKNANGSFYCHCLPGYRLLLGDTQFKNSNENTCQNKTFSTTQPTKGENETLYNIESFVTKKTLWEQREKGYVASTATFFLQHVESTVLEMALKNPEKSIQKINYTTLAAETQIVTGNCSEEAKIFSLQAQMNSMRTHCRDIIQGSVQGPSAIAFISYTSLGDIIKADFFEDTTESNQVYLNSQVVSAAIGPKRNISLSKSITLIFQHVKMNPRSQKTFCVYWKSSKDGGHWSRDGCFLVHVNESHTICNSTHLSSFAVLMAVTSQVKDPMLDVITYVGLGFSLLCLFLASLTFLLCRTIQNTSTSIHLQLSLCLFLAHLLFLTGIDQTKSKVLCPVIAGSLHYLYLASFTWMLLDGLHLFLTARNLTVVNYSSVNRPMKKLMFPVGYGVPAVIVTISATSRPHLYGTSDRCWLHTDKGFVWTFLGPVCAIISINLVFFLMTFWIVKNKLASLNSDVSTLQNTRILTFKATAQLFILGCTWCLGFLQVGPAAQVMAYLFTIINSLQGVFIFLVYCLLNQQVLEQYRKWFKRTRKFKVESEMNTFSSKVLSDASNLNG